MIVNSRSLLKAQPLTPMIQSKVKEQGVSWGMSEAGYDIRVKQDLWLHPFRRFTLASSVEGFSMPSDLVAIVHDKSTWARLGVAVQNTVIEPGWKGFLTLEITYHGWGAVRIPAGSGIAQVVFHEVKHPRIYNGKYQNQIDDVQEAILG